MPKYLDGEGLSYFWGKIKSLFTNVVYHENDDGTSGEASIPSSDANIIEIVKVNGDPLTPDASKAVDIQVPTSLSQLSPDSTHRVVTDTEKTTWNNKGTYTKPSGGIPATDLEDGVIPIVPTNVSEFTNDAGYLTQESLSGYTTTDYFDNVIGNLSAVATSGDYDDLINKPTISDVSGKEDSSNKVSTILGYETSTTEYPNTKAVADYAQTISNKVTSFQSTPDDIHYPSEKLVKDSLDTKIDNTDVEELTAIDVDNTPTANSSNLVTSGGIYNVLINKQDKMQIVSASGTTLSAIANIYHNFTSEVNTLAITLPAVTDVTHITNIVFMLTTGTTPAITFAASGTGVNVIAQDGFSIEASTTYEINAIFNGTLWVVAAMKLSTTPINS